MGSCWAKTKEFICSFLVYDTVSVVRIKDTRLAILHYLCLLGIVFYIVFYTIFWNQAYYAIESPVGTVRVNPMAPPERDGDRWKDIKDLPYCKMDGRSELYGFDLLKCKYFDSAIDVFPQAVDSSITIATRIKFREEDSNNTNYDTPDTAWIPNKTTMDAYTLADIERFTLQIDHTFFGPIYGAQSNARDLPGWFVDEDGNNISDSVSLSVPDVEVIGQVGKTDIISVGTLLNATGIDIDAVSVVDNESIRYSGAIFLVKLDYQNSYTVWLQPNEHYTINVRLLNNTEYKAVQSVYTKQLKSRTIYDRHGIHFVFLQTGKLVKFDFQVLLLSLVSGMGLLAVSTTIVDFISTKLLGGKEVVTNLKYRQTTDLTDLSEKQLSLLASKLRRTQEKELSLNSNDEDRSVESVVTLREPLIDKDSVNPD